MSYSNKESQYAIHHVLIDTGEWGTTYVDSFTEAEISYRCKTAAKGNVIVTFYSSNGDIIKQKILGSSSAVE
jgi:hypothetical protein